MEGVSKEVKWAWADEAARRIQEATDKKGEMLAVDPVEKK